MFPLGTVRVTLAVVAFALPGAALAQAIGYIAATGAVTFANDLRTDAGIRGRLKDGYGFTVATGGPLGPVRAEIEAGYRRNKVDSARGFGFTVPGRGSATALSGMVNAYLDPAFQFGLFKPYVGGGIGVARFRARNVTAVGLPPVGQVTDLGSVSGSRTGFAYQLMAGVGASVAPNTTLTVGYRYFATPGVNVRVPLAERVHIDGLKIHAIEAGARFAF